MDITISVIAMASMIPGPSTPLMMRPLKKH
jgi:hypothetical protein